MATDHITVCVCTYKRAGYLPILVRALQGQETSHLFDLSIVVVDNDRLASAKKLVEDLGRNSPVPIHYFVEPEQNISLARNRAITEARGQYIAFIDDDEVPGLNWLLTLYKFCVLHKVAGVLGPVLPRYEEEPPEWVTRGGFHERPTHRTGEVLGWKSTRTGNVLLRREILQPGENRFRREFGSGGEDRDLFRRLIAQGLTFVWCAEAPVYETIPAVRCTRRFMLRRALLRGQLPHFRVVHLAQSLVAIPLYTALLPVFLVFSHHMFMKYLIKDCDHIGRVFSFCGIQLIREKYVLD